MANKDFERMIKLGEWLERCLNPNIKPWEINDLFNEGLKLIGIRHQRIQPSKIIENLKLKPEDTVYNNIKSLSSKIKKYQELEKPFDLISFKEDEDGNLPDGIFKEKTVQQAMFAMEKFKKENPGVSLEREIYFFFLHIKEVNALLKELYKSQLPWQKAIPILDQKEPFHGAIHNLKNNFQNITQTFIEENEQIKISKAIQSGITLSETEWCYRIVLSNIFFDFLLLGGQDYFMFCEHCGRFTAIQRKGRKKFCSDICRSNNRFTK